MHPVSSQMLSESEIKRSLNQLAANLDACAEELEGSVVSICFSLDRPDTVGAANEPILRKKLERLNRLIRFCNGTAEHLLRLGNELHQPAGVDMDDYLHRLLMICRGAIDQFRSEQTDAQQLRDHLRGGALLPEPTFCRMGELEVYVTP